jgi:nitrite reductase/ring-hydroxylating ferredoxin subunit
MSRWIPVASIEECPPGESLERVAGDYVLALFNVDGVYYALDGICPHQGGPLGKGRLSGCVVTCPWHGWQFDVCDGRHSLNPRIVQPRFPVRVENEMILVELP